MEQRRLGSSGLRVSRLGLGTLTWGRDTDEYEAAEQLTAFVDAGGTFVDTAASYGRGAAEELLGSLLGDVVDRRDVVLATKAGVDDAGRVDTSARALLRSLDESLARLRTDHVDLWLVQAWDPDVPLDETLGVLQAARASGRARYVGVANHVGWQLATAVTLGAAAGVPVVCDEVEYSLVCRAPEDDVLPAAGHLRAGVVAWAPLGRGVLTGKYRSGTPADSRGGSPHLSGYVQPYLGPAARGVVDAVATAAEGLDAAPLEVALAWVRDAPGIVSAVVGARTAAQLRGSLAAEDLELPAEIRQALADASDR